MLLGRAAEQRELDLLIQHARVGTSGAVVLRGEPGIGKTALLGYAAERAGSMPILRATGIEAEAELAFGGLHALLRPLAGRLDAQSGRYAALRGALGLGDHAVPPDRLGVAAATHELLVTAAEQQPVLLLLDDLQWLDRPTLDALTFAIRRLGNDAIACVLAGRADAPAIAGLPARDLAGLSRPATGELVKTVTGMVPAAEVAALLHSETGGNPLALAEMAQAMTREQLAGTDITEAPLKPGTAIRQRFSARLDRLDPAVRTALMVAAAGGRCPVAAVTAVSARLTSGRADALNEAEAAGLLRLNADAVEFAHPLLRSVAYHSATPAERRSAHRALAEVLASSDADRAAWQLAAAAVGYDDHAAGTLDATASNAASRGAPLVAAAAWERAAQLTAAPGTRAARYAAAAEAALGGGDTDRARRLASESPAAQQPRWRARMLAVKGRADVAAGKMAAAQQALREAAALIAEADPPLAAELLSESVAAAIEAGLDEEASRDAERMSKLAERSGETAQFLADLTAGRLAWIRGDPGLGMLLVQRAASRLTSRPALALSAGRQLDVARAYSDLGDHPRAWPYYERTIELARSTGAVGKLPVALSDASFAAAETGKWLQALALGSQALELAQATGQDYLACDALVTLAGVEAAQGRAQDCLKHVHEADQLASELGLRLTQLLARRQRALLELGTGRLEEAIEHYEALRRLAAQWDISHPYYSPIADLIEAYARAGALDEARKLLPEFLAQVPSNANPLPAARAARCQGIVAAEDYDPHFRTAINLQEQSGHAFQHARSLLCYGERLRRAQRRRDARIQLRASIETFDLLDARPWADRARAELRASGETISGGGAGGDRLTPQELQIALLVTQGRTNAEIGRAIFLSTRTVEFHLSRAYRKLGISSRTELASRLASTPATRQNSAYAPPPPPARRINQQRLCARRGQLSVTLVVRGCQLSAVSKRARRSVSRSAGSLAKTRRRYRRPLGPQPSIGVAATWARVNSRLDASPGVRPMLRVSMSSDQPPCGRTHGYPASWSRTRAQRCCQTLVAAATSAPDPGWFRAAATACWAMPTWQTTLVRPARPMSAMISPGPTTQPTRQPIIRSSLDADPTVIVQSARPGWAPGWTGGWPSKRIRSIAASQMTQARCRLTGPAIASKCSPPRTAPVGMTGLISSTAAVRGPMAAASSPGSVAHPPGPGVQDTNRGTPPARRIRLTRPA